MLFASLLATMSTGLLAGDAVILLHGLARRAASMEDLELALQAQHAVVRNLSYPSRHAPIEVLANQHLSPVVDELRRAGHQRIHFVTHSLGGIVVRQYLRENPQLTGSRMVMLGPPNRGSELVDHLQRLPLFGWINGPAGYQLGTDANSLPLALGSAPIEIGVIAGTRSYNPLYSVMIPGPDDGKVSVESARLEGMSDFLVLPVNHTFMMGDKQVIRQSLHFLSVGRFDR